MPVPSHLVLPCALGLCALTACGGLESKLDGGDGTWQIAEFQITLTDVNTGAVRLDETLNNAGQVQFVTDYDDWGGQYAIMELPTPWPFYPSVSNPPTELMPNTRYVLWDTSDSELHFAWGSDWSDPEALVLEREGDGYRATSSRDFAYGIVESEHWEMSYVLVP